MHEKKTIIVHVNLSYCQALIVHCFCFIIRLLIVLRVYWQCQRRDYLCVTTLKSEKTQNSRFVS